MDIKEKSFSVMLGKGDVRVIKRVDPKNRMPHQGAREIARRQRQAAKQAQKAAASAA